MAYCYVAQVCLLFSVVKRIPVALIVVALIISLAIVVRWIDPRGNRVRVLASNSSDTLRGAPENQMREKETQANDCDQWAGMSFKEKKTKYQVDPERWAGCLCEGEGCELDRIYLTGRVSR